MFDPGFSTWLRVKDTSTTAASATTVLTKFRTLSPIFGTEMIGTRPLETNKVRAHKQNHEVT